MTDIQLTELDFDGTDDGSLFALISKNVPHYAPTEEAKRRHEEVRTRIHKFAGGMVDLLPQSPERDEVIWTLTNGVMFAANAAIARNHDLLEPKPCERPECGPYEDVDLGAVVQATHPGMSGAEQGVRCRCPGVLCSHKRMTRPID